MPETGAGFASLWDWRRRVSDIYAAVRAGNGESAWSRWRTERDALFRTHTQSPVQREGFEALPFYAYDPALRFSVSLHEQLGAPFSVPAGADGAVQLQPFAVTDGLSSTLGRELTLFWIKGYGGGVFLPFADATSGRDSYGGGRYLLDTIKGADLGTDRDGRTVLDFNYAYNPSCSYSDLYVCPLAPPENRLPGMIMAGERLEAG